MPVIVTNDIVYVNDGETASELIADAYGEIDVLSRGTLTDSLATNEGMIFVDPGATVLRTSASELGYICVDGDATDLTAETSGAFDIGMGGTLDTGLVKSGGMGTVYRRDRGKCHDPERRIFPEFWRNRPGHKRYERRIVPCPGHDRDHIHYNRPRRRRHAHHRWGQCDRHNVKRRFP